MTNEEQRALATLLSEKEAERGALLNELNQLEAEILAHRTDLEAARRQSYEELLDRELSARNLTYTITVDDTLETFIVSVYAVAGGDIELGKLKAALGSEDTSNISTNFMLTYLGVPPPWS